MRLLLDESLPLEFAELIVGHDVSTVRWKQWTGVKNGRLLQLAADAGFDALVTPDRSIEFQVNRAKLPLSRIVLRSRTNRIQELRPLPEELLDRLTSLQPRSVTHIGG